VVVLVVSLFSVCALVLVLLATSVRAAAAGRTADLLGPPLVAGRGARFGDATAAERSVCRTRVAAVSPAPAVLTTPSRQRPLGAARAA